MSHSMPPKSPTAAAPLLVTKKHCLVVDDSDVIRKVARHLLGDMAFETSEAENGQEALERCNQRMPDAVIVDWHMPVMSGMEFISSLRMQTDGAKPVIFYCTTENDPVDIARAMAAGANEFILKPFDRDTIRGKLANAGLA
jgi:two-component system chemotaxis response regulator CheY